MKGRALAVLITIALLGATSATATSSGVTAKVTINPTSGSPTTTFVVHFRAPNRTGRVGSIERHYVLTVSGPAHTSGCINTASTAPPDSPAHARIGVKLGGARLGGRWCAGEFHGTIEELQSAYCGPGLACPLYVLLLGKVGQFSFRVKPTM